MKLKTVKIKDLIQHPQNPNTHPKEQIDELQDSLKQFDQVKNIVVWKGQVIAGNGLLAAAQKQGREKIQVQDVSDWPEEKALKFMVADNRLADMAIMNDDLLSDLITGFDEPLDVPGVDEEFLSGLNLGDGLKEEDLTNSGNENINETFQILIECKDEQEQIDLLLRFEKEKIKCRALIS